MTSAAFGHSLATLHDGLSVILDRDGPTPLPVPLTSTAIDVTFRGGLALIRVTRHFTNAETQPIEAILTCPVGIDTVVTGLSATVNGRRLVAQAQSRENARTTYEDALDRGKLAILHEEVLRGIHMISVAQLPAGAAVEVTLDAVAPLAMLAEGAMLRLPQTVGQVYGASPLLPVDDLATANGVQHHAHLTLHDAPGPVLDDAGQPLGRDLAHRVTLDRAITLRLPHVDLSPVHAVSGDGRPVTLSFGRSIADDTALELAVLVDRSGSTGSPAGPDGPSLWQVMRDGLALGLGQLTPADRIALWQFDTDCTMLGQARGNAAATLAEQLAPPRGGTALGAAITCVRDSGARDILVLTDGKTWADEVAPLAGIPCRISALLLGEDSLDASIGHLVSLTGGQLFYVPGSDVAAALDPALAALRLGGGAVSGQVTEGQPQRLTCLRAGLQITATWGAWSPDGPQPAAPDSAGRFAASLALPLLPAADAQALALANHLCTLATSLVLVDEAGIASEGLPQTRKVPLSTPRLSGSAPFVASLAEASVSASFAPPVRRDASHAPQMFRLNRRASPPRRDAPGIDWAAQASALLALDLSGLSPAARTCVADLAARPDVAALATRLGLDARLMALALLALQVDGRDRHAARFARHLLDQQGLTLARDIKVFPTQPSIFTDFPR